MSKEELDQLRSVPAVARQTLIDYAAQRRALSTAPRVRLDATDEERREAAHVMQYDLAHLRSQTLAGLQTLATETEARAQRVTLAYKQSLRPSTGSPEGDLAREAAEDRAWRRIERHLERDAIKPGDGSLHASQVAANNLASVDARLKDYLQTALSEGDEATVHAILTESPSFVGFHFDGQTGAAAKADLQQIVAEARPEYGAVLQELADVDAGVSAVRSALTSAVRGIDEGRSLVSVPSWPGEDPAPDVLLAEDGDTVRVSGWGGGNRTLRLEDASAA